MVRRTQTFVHIAYMDILCNDKISIRRFTYALKFQVGPLVSIAGDGPGTTSLRLITKRTFESENVSIVESSLARIISENHVFPIGFFTLC